MASEDEIITGFNLVVYRHFDRDVTASKLAMLHRECRHASVSYCIKPGRGRTDAVTSVTAGRPTWALTGAYNRRLYIYIRRRGFFSRTRAADKRMADLTLDAGR